MANSRLEKIGTIYQRTRGLIQSGALNYKERPLWYDLYEAFPPFQEPRFDRPKPNIELKKIFYKEDTIRALLHKNVKGVGTVNLLNRTTESFTQKFISTYQKLEEQYGSEQCEPEVIFRETLDILRRDREGKTEENLQSDDGTLTTAFKAAGMERTRNKLDRNKFQIKIKDIFET